MGWTYRKAINLGPFRISLSKSGIGYSVGTKGFRTGVSSQKRHYTSISLPGTGLRYQTTHRPPATKKPASLLSSLFGF